MNSIALLNALLVVSILGHENDTVLSTSFIQLKMGSALIKNWKIVEIQDNQFPFAYHGETPGCYKMTIAGKPTALEFSGYGDSKGNLISGTITASPRYCIYFVPVKYKAILIKTESREHKRIDEIQYHGHFMCPRIIGQTTHFFIYGIYDTRGYLNLSEPKDMSFEILQAMIINTFDIK